MSDKISTPEPGIYYNVPFAEYLAWEAVSNSRISLAMQSLMHYKAGFCKDPTPALRLGQFIHCGVLEPLAISMRYAVVPPFELDSANCTKDGKPSTSKATTYYSNKLLEFERANAGKEFVEQRRYDDLVNIANKLRRHKRAAEYLGEQGEAEVSMLWVDEETQLTCKARIDLLNSGINDLKTCLNAMKFPKSISTYGYHRQGAFYQDGLATLTGEVKPFRLIAVESTAPHGIRAAPLSEDAIETGQDEVRRALISIAEATKTGIWPGYDDPSSWCLPSYHGSSDAIEITVDGETVLI